MPPRQVWMFTFGCWATIATGALHLVGHLAGPAPPANETERQLTALATTYRYLLPGGTGRTQMDILDGFSLVFALQLAVMGAVGLIVRKRGHRDAALMLGVARAFAVGSVVLLGISLLKFFIIPTLAIAVMAVCFLAASVESPKGGGETSH